MDEHTGSYFFAAYDPSNIANSPRTVYSFKEVIEYTSTPKAKSIGVRFKRFDTPKKVLEFYNSGNNITTDNSGLPTSIQSVEPSIPHPSVPQSQMNPLKSAIEKGNINVFSSMVKSNPRYLVNTDSDTAAVVAAGCHYNALHIAAKNGMLEVASNILETISSINFLIKLYGTDEDDVRPRREIILASYLNTPEKGFCETPLHFAAKFGHLDIVKLLVRQPLLQKNITNKHGETAQIVACSRYSGKDKASRKVEMEVVLSGFYVALYRPRDNCTTAEIIISEAYPCEHLSKNVLIDSPLLPKYSLAACAGPFGSKERAEKFYQEWSMSQKDIKLSDMDKGYERVGRDLCGGKIPWVESWCFLDNLIDICSKEGLSLFNSLLHQEKLKKNKRSDDNVRQRLQFDDEDSDEDELKNTLELSKNEIDEEIFEDALTTFDDSMSSFTGHFAGLSLKSPINARTDSSEDLSEFVTPPVTPPPIYIKDYPTKVDNDVFLALSRVPESKVAMYPHVRMFMNKIRRVSNNVRADWPALDSPRGAKFKRVLLS